MEPEENTIKNNSTDQFPFKAETRKLLDILIHSLYRDREIFLRELISNASDALTRLNYEMLTNREILEPEKELFIQINIDPENQLLMIQDSGIGMTEQELKESLGTIAHSGARAFIDAVEGGEKNLIDVIGQFGVGFYSAFMVAEWIRVTSRSYDPKANAATWFSTGADTYSIEHAEGNDRGTLVTIKLKEDAQEFLKDYRLKGIVQKHSDFIPFPIYLGDDKEQVNRQTAIWRQQPRDLSQDDYDDFYKHLTLDNKPPFLFSHLVVDAPVQMYAIVFIPEKGERNIFSPRKEDGLKLYSRKVLIDEYCKDLLPEYFRFVDGVVDSEDLPLNVSRETIQSNRLMAQLKKLITKKVIDSLKDLAESDEGKYNLFWETWGRNLKEGVAIDQQDPDALYPLLRFQSTRDPESWTSLEEYVSRMKEDQKDIFYILSESEHSAIRSPHMDIFKKLDYEVLLLTDPIDAFMLVRLTNYNDKKLTNVSKADIPLPKEDQEIPAAEAVLPTEDWVDLIERFKSHLGDRVSDVRMTDRLSDSPARLVDQEGGLSQELQKVYTLLNEKFEVPQKTLELNPRHPILVQLNDLPAGHELGPMIIDQVYENALLIEGIHPDPSNMIDRIQRLMEAALKEN